MQVLIISDTHAMERDALLTILKHHKVSYYIHCGDIFMPYDPLPLSNFYLVRGNNDFNNAPDTLSLTIDNLHFFITHGHHYDVYYGVDSLVEAAKETGANIICFGHTHEQYRKMIDNILVINPGSAFYPRGAYQEPTYCIFDTHTKEVVYYKVKNNTPCDPFIPSKENYFSFKNLFKK